MIVLTFNFIHNHQIEHYLSDRDSVIDDIALRVTLHQPRGSLTPITDKILLVQCPLSEGTLASMSPPRRVSVSHAVACNGKTLLLLAILKYSAVNSHVVFISKLYH